MCMNKYFSSFFIVVLCIPFFIRTMDAPILNDAQPIISLIKPFGRVINIAHVKEIAFLGNTQLIVHEQDRRPCLINLDSQECSYFSQFIPFKCSLATDQSKERVLFSRQDDLIKIRIYDSVSKQFISARISYDVDSDKYFPICFDEKKPNSILVEKGVPTSMVSYDYNPKEISAEGCLSEGYTDSSMDNFQYLYN